ncbi:9301_t:CDS:1, partial [Entrophospora sp. SA101]
DISHENSPTTELTKKIVVSIEVADKHNWDYNNLYIYARLQPQPHIGFSVPKRHLSR